MIPTRIAMTGLAAALVLTPAAPAIAGAGDAIVGGIIGGIIGGAIANQPRPPAPQAAAPRPAVSSAVREQNRAVQSALNYFNFPVGTPDGAIGPRTRSAISAYQAFLGFPATGALTEFERTVLTAAHQRGLSGAPDALRLASGPQGTRALLVAQRDLMLGGSPAVAGAFGGLPPDVVDSVVEIARSSNVEADQLMQRHGFIQLADMNGDGRTDYILDTSVTGSAFWCNATACTVRVFVSTPEGHRRNDFQAFNVTPAMFACTGGTCIKVGEAGRDTTVALAPAPAPVAPPLQSATLPVAPALPVSPAPQPVASAPALPGFLAPGGGVQAPSLASHCARIALVTNSNGGYVTLAGMTDPAFALAEQFCLARTYAIAEGEDMVARLPGVTPDQIAAECGQIGPATRTLVAALALKPRDEVLRDTSDFVIRAGAVPDVLAATAKICLSVGYRTDAMDVALGSGLLLAALGQRPYAELVGHHLREGFGTAARTEHAVQWYDLALGAISGGVTPVFLPGQPDRTDLLRAAVDLIAGRAAAAPRPALPSLRGISAFGGGANP